MTTISAETSEGFSLQINRTFNANREAVFDAWVCENAVSQWLAPDPGMIMKVETLDVREGGQYQFRMTNVERENFIVTGEYLTIKRPEELVFTWAWIHGDDKTVMLITLKFIDKGEGTEMQMTHERLPDQGSKDHHNEGWLACFNRLAKVVEN